MPAGHGDGVALSAVYKGRTVQITAKHTQRIRALVPDRTLRRSDMTQYGESVLLLTVCADDISAGLDDSGFLSRDLSDRVAKDCHMIERDRRDHAHLRTANDVGCVAAAAETGFQYDNITALLDKVQEGDCGRELKLTDRLSLGQRQAFAGNRDTLRKVREIVARDHRAVDTDTFVELHEIRRGVQACAQTGCLKRGGDHGSGRALAVRTCNVYKFQPVLRISEPVK